MYTGGKPIRQLTNHPFKKKILHKQELYLFANKATLSDKIMGRRWICKKDFFEE